MTGENLRDDGKGKMSRWMKIILLISIAFLAAGCGGIAQPATARVTPSGQPPTATWLPTRTPIPTIAPYDKVPTDLGDGWKTGSLADAGIDPVKMSSMLQFIYRGESGNDVPILPNGYRKIQNIHGMLIVRDGRLVFEKYYGHYYWSIAHNLASVTKSITSLLVGIAIEQGYIGSVQDKVLSYFPEYFPLEEQENKESITIEDLLTMRSGFDCDDWDPDSRSYYLKSQPRRSDEIEFILNVPMRDIPGSRYSYCTWGTEVLNALLIKATGTELRAFADQYLFQPLDIKSAVWQKSTDKWKNIDGIASMSMRDMARIGQLVLQNGSWNGVQIVPEDWLRISMQEHVSLPFNQTWGNSYGYLWWLSDANIAGRPVHSVSASGYGGQVITIFPDLDMVIVITGGNYENDEGQPFKIMEQFILPAVKPLVDQ